MNLIGTSQLKFIQGRRWLYGAVLVRDDSRHTQEWVTWTYMNESWQEIWVVHGSSDSFRRGGDDMGQCSFVTIHDTHKNESCKHTWMSHDMNLSGTRQLRCIRGRSRWWGSARSWRFTSHTRISQVNIHERVSHNMNLSGTKHLRFFKWRRWWYGAVLVRDDSWHTQEWVRWTCVNESWHEWVWATLHYLNESWHTCELYSNESLHTFELVTWHMNASELPRTIWMSHGTHMNYIGMSHGTHMN